MTDDVKALVEALKPFADYMQNGMGLNHKGEPLPDNEGVGWVYLTVGDFRRAKAALEALSRDREGEQKVVAVKPLEWVVGTWHGTVVFKAQSLCGEYMVAPKAYSSGWLWRLDPESEVYASVEDEDDGKAAAQADYERRILSALASPAPDEVRRMALEEAADYLKERVEANKGLPCSLPLSEAEAAIRSLASAPPAEDPKDAADSLCSDCPPIGYPTDETRCAPCPRRAALRASSEKEPKT